MNHRVRVGRTVVLAGVAAVLALAGCDTAERATQEASSRTTQVRDCAGLAALVANLRLDPQSADQLEDTLRSLDDRIAGLDNTEVRQAAQQFRDSVRAYVDAVTGSADAAARQEARDRVQQAARDLAGSCDIPLDRILGLGISVTAGPIG